MNTQEIKVTPNHKARTFTLRVYNYDNGKLTYKVKYRTNPTSREDFDLDLYNTDRDWKSYLNRSFDYYKVN